MKKLLVLVCFSLSSLVGYSQESVINLSAGYLVNINSDNLQSGSGNSWRVIGSFQETLKNQKWAVGVSTGVMQFQY
jgi:hypothetical protein